MPQNDENSRVPKPLKSLPPLSVRLLALPVSGPLCQIGGKEGSFAIGLRCFIDSFGTQE